MRATIGEAGGTTIEGKLVGDGLMAVFNSARQAIDGALRCREAAAATELSLHLGIHAGDVIREKDNVYGGAVNIASRISALSAPGEVLVSDVVRTLGRTSAGVTFEDRGEHTPRELATWCACTPYGRQRSNGARGPLRPQRRRHEHRV